MQSTGHTSTQAVSLVSIHGSVMIKGMLASLRFGLYGSCFRGRLRISGASWPESTDYTLRPSRGRKTHGLLFQPKKHHRAGRHRVAKRFIHRLSEPAGVERQRTDALLAAPGVNGLHHHPSQSAVTMVRLGVDVVDKRQTAAEVARTWRPRENRDAAARNHPRSRLHHPRAIDTVRHH